MKPAINFEILRVGVTRRQYIWTSMIIVLPVLIVGGIGHSLLMTVYVLIATTPIFIATIGYQKLRARNTAIEKFVIANHFQMSPSYNGVPPALLLSATDRRTMLAFSFPIDGYNATLSRLQYLVPNGTKRSLTFSTVLHIKNPKAYPHLFLDGLQNGGTDAYSASQYIPLEGNFNDYFKLYAPEGQSTDALSIITPDIMQTLIDSGRPYDIELSGTDIWIIGKLDHYGPEKMEAMLDFAYNLVQELQHKNTSWQPDLVAAAQTLKFGYSRRVQQYTAANPKQYFVLTMVASLVFIIVGMLIAAHSSH